MQQSSARYHTEFPKFNGKEFQTMPNFNKPSMQLSQLVFADPISQQKVKDDIKCLCT